MTAEPAPPPPVSLVLGHASQSYDAVTAAVVQELLERIGCRVTLVSGGHEDLLAGLARGEIDLLATVWLPEAHADAWARHGMDAEEVATLYERAHFFWATPAYVPSTEVGSISDLTRPAVAARMTRLIRGIDPGAPLSVRSAEAMAAYGLEAAGYVFRPGSPADWVAAHDAALRDRRWFVFPALAPHYLHRDQHLRALADPKAVLGGANRGSLVSPRGRLQALAPRAYGVLRRLRIGLDGVTEMDRLVSVDLRTPRQAARAWMSVNSHRVEAWLRDASG